MKTNEDLTPEHSLAQNGKSFHWAGRFLGPKAGRDATRLYSFCRILDDMADGDIKNGPKRLKHIRSGLIDATVTGDLLLPELTNFISKIQCYEYGCPNRWTPSRSTDSCFSR